MARLPAEQVAAYAAGAGLTDPERLAIAVAIAGWSGSPHPGESGGDPTAANRRDASADGVWSGSFGLWQIRGLTAERGTGHTRDELSLYDPAFNARSMWEISNEGTNWRPWAIYTSGAYRRNLPQATDVVGGGVTPAAGGTVAYGLPGIPDLGALDALTAVVTGRGDVWRRIALGVAGAALMAAGATLLGRDIVAPAAGAVANVTKVVV